MKNILIILILLTSCESKRAGRKISWLKERGYLQTDTIRDTIRGWSVDTFVRFDTLNHQDTLILEKNGIKVVTVTKWRTREQILTITQRDTIRLIPVVKQTCPETSWWHKFIEHFAIGVFVCAAFILLILKQT